MGELSLDEPSRVAPAGTAFQQIRQDVEQRALGLRARAAGAEPGETRIGVVFVHGVGSQSQSATVREFGEPLVAWLREWHRARGVAGFRLLFSNLSYGARTNEPARFALRIPARDDEPGQTWVVTEAWWAARLEAPRFPTMASWVVGTSLGVVGHLRSELARGPVDPAPRRWMRIIERASTFLLFVGYTISALIGLIPLLALLLVSKAPVPGLQPAVLRLVQPLLIDNLGDFYVFVYDEIQALHVRKAVAETVTWLVDGARCEQIVVVGHSQGTVVALDALASDDLEPSRRSRVKRLMTVGAALNNAWDAKDVDGIAHRQIPRWVDVPWLNVWAAYDPLPGGGVKREAGEPGPEELPVTNELNVLTDHGGYFQNHEEYTARLAQEIECPGSPERSRFFPGTEGQRGRKERRRLRVSILVGLRLVAMLSFALAIGARYVFVPGTDAVVDGTSVWAALTALPVVGGILGGFAAVLSAIASVIGLAVQQVAPSPPYPLRVLAALALGAGLLVRALATAALAALALGLPFAGAYVLAVSTILVPWHRREALASAGTHFALETSARIALRALLILAVIVAAAIAVALLPPLSEVSERISEVMTGS